MTMGMTFLLAMASAISFEAVLLIQLASQFFGWIYVYATSPIYYTIYVPKRFRHIWCWINFANWLKSNADYRGYMFIQWAEAKLYDIPKPRKPPDKPTKWRKYQANRRYRRPQQRGPDVPSIPFMRKVLAATSTTSPPHQVLQFDSDSHPILVDSGATSCITNDRDHFVGDIKKCNVTAQGVGKAGCTHMGTIRWIIEDDNGKPHQFDIPNSFYCPNLPFCLLSPQHVARERRDHHPKRHGTGGGEILDDQMSFFWDQRKYRRTIQLSSQNAHVGFIRSAPSYSTSTELVTACCLFMHKEPQCLAPHVIPPDEDEFAQEDKPTSLSPEGTELPEGEVFTLLPVNEGIDGTNTKLTFGLQDLPTLVEDADEATQMEIINTEHDIISDDDLELQNPTHEMLRQHYKLNHLSFHKMKTMAECGELPRRLASCRMPKCAACLYAKAHKIPWRTKSSANRGKILQAEHAGQCVSIDQLESSTPGLIAQLRGFITKQRYKVVTVFTDHFSDLSYVHVQRTTNMEDTLTAKKTFETWANAQGVPILHYHCDNGRFADKAFTDHVLEKGQTISFCGANAHFQNGRSEKRIRDLQDQARVSLVHAKHRWSTAISANLWPYALRLANLVHQITPDASGISRLEKFSGNEIRADLKHIHHFGCPTYVLTVQDGKKGPKWEERARCGVYLGHSPLHARSVSLVLSLETGLVSPQFHVVHDDLFETVTPGKGEAKHLKGLMPQESKWQTKAGFVKDEAEDQNSKLNEGASAPSLSPSDELLPTFSPEDTNMDQPIGTAAQGPDAPAAETTVAQANEGAQTPTSTLRQRRRDRRRSRQERQDPPVTSTQVQETQGTQLSAEPLTRSSRSGRSLSAPIKFKDYVLSPAVTGEIFNSQPEMDLQEAMRDPIAFAASSDPDTMYHHQAMNQEDAPLFREAALQEVRDHEKNGHFVLVPRDSVPDGMKVLQSVWSYKRKRRIATREIYKRKARLNVHGGMQEKFVNFWETYSPVVTWFAIRLFVTLAYLRNWHTRQIDFVLAYPQADVECEMYIEIPQGFEYNGNRKSHVLKLLKNVYGQRQAGRVWNKHIHSGLIERGYEQSKIDSCVYYKGTTILLLYVDDGIFVGPNADEITALIKSLQEDDTCSTNYNVTDEGDVDDYLGVKFNKREDGRVELIQPHLIQQIIDDLGLKEDSVSKSTPALSTQILHRDSEGAPFDEDWNYRSIIGKLNFLEKSTRPDLSTAVHQCARYSVDPKKSHGEAVKRIGRYLLATKERGIIYDPKEDSFECWADASFCGDWVRELAEHDPSTARSRIGHIIKYGGCPLIWHSKMATEICLSTTEAEYVSLSIALRETICLMQLLAEASSKGITGLQHCPTIHCKAFEDNSGALEIANVPKMRPRTKFINTKYHHFREFVSKGLITIKAVSTVDQQGDLFTKPLGRELFEKFRRLIMGW